MTSSELARFVSAHPMALVFFTAPWCHPCKEYLPRVESACARRGIPFGVVDVKESPDLTALYGIQSVPVILAFEFGQPWRSRVGALNNAALLKFLYEIQGDLQ